MSNRGIGDYTLEELMLPGSRPVPPDTRSDRNDPTRDDAKVIDLKAWKAKRTHTQ